MTKYKKQDRVGEILKIVKGLKKKKGKKRKGKRKQRKTQKTIAQAFPIGTPQTIASTIRPHNLGRVMFPSQQDVFPTMRLESIERQYNNAVLQQQTARDVGYLKDFVKNLYNRPQPRRRDVILLPPSETVRTPTPARDRVRTMLESSVYEAPSEVKKHDIQFTTPTPEERARLKEKLQKAKEAREAEIEVKAPGIEEVIEPATEEEEEATSTQAEDGDFDDDDDVEEEIEVQESGAIKKRGRKPSAKKSKTELIKDLKKAGRTGVSRFNIEELREVAQNLGISIDRE